MASIEHILGKYTADIDATIKSSLVGASYELNGIVHYHFGWADQNFQPAHFERGKMFRPTMTLLVFEALTGCHREALPAAAAIEMIHNFSLMHDDIEDNDTERRGRPTAWTIWGKPRIINAGDFLYSLAFKALYELDPEHFLPGQIFTAQRLINQACLALTEGQDLDLRFETVRDVSVDMYVDMVYKKTGALIEAAIVSGAVLGTADETILQHYRTFARNVGIAFQVRDDVLGIWGDTAKTGKSAANDLRRKKKTLPVLYALDHVAGSRKEKLTACYAGPEPLTDEEIQFVRESLEEIDAYTYTQNIASSYRDKAFLALHQIGISNQAQAELESLSRFLVDRAY